MAFLKEQEKKWECQMNEKYVLKEIMTQRE